MLTTKSRYIPRAVWQMAEGISTRWEILANGLAILCFAEAYGLTVWIGSAPMRTTWLGRLTCSWQPSYS